MPAKQKRTRKRRLGMTLIEIMLVVVIMASITAAVGIGIMHSRDEANKNLARAAVRNIASAVQAYQLEHPEAECPTADELVKSGVLNPGTSLKDPWGHDYRIECEDENVQVRSAGKDREPGTPDDLTLL